MVKKILLISLAVLFALATLAISLKSTVFRYVLAQKVQRAEQKFGASINYSNPRLKGLTHISINDVDILLPSRSLSLRVSSLKVDMSLARLIRFNVVPKVITADSVKVCIAQLIQPDSLTEISDSIDLQISKNILNSGIAAITQYSKPLYFFLTGNDYNINSISIGYSNKDDSIKVLTQPLNIRKGIFTTTLSVINSNSKATIHVYGNAEVKKNLINYSIKPENHFKIPIVDSRLGLHFGFDSLKFAVDGNRIARDSIRLGMHSSIYGISAKHKQLADSTIRVDSAGVMLFANLSSTSSKFLVPSAAWVNSLRIPFELSIETSQNTAVALSISTGIFPATNLFESIPKSLFKNIDNVKVLGDLDFNLNFCIDFSVPENLMFSAKLQPISFKLLSSGKVDFSGLNHNFIHFIPLSDSLYKAVLVDSSSHQFRPLNRISPYLVNAVVISEDGGFFHHKGFDAEGFSFALARNIKDKRLARGGSTITMQLVKNLYLNRNKTIVRKAEEALIVWLIETQRMVSKDRLLEIYLNIIDWGPNINGITEAAKFYFDKDPLEISLNEAIFLAGIIPQPSRFTSYFDEGGNLKDYMQGFYTFVGSTMLQRSMITDEELQAIEPRITITGSARDWLTREKNLILESDLSDK